MTVDTVSGEGVAPPTYGEVRDSIATAREAGAKFFEQIVWQVEHRAWEVLGYADWDAMREAEYADMGVAVPRADRPEIVTRLRRVGLTQQQIATTVGVSVGTINADLNFSSENDLPSTIETSRGPRPATYTCERPELEQQLTDLLADDPSIQDAQYRAEVTRAVASVKLTSFDPDRINAVSNDDTHAAIDGLMESLNRWHQSIRTKRGVPDGLRVIREGTR